MTSEFMLGAYVYLLAIFVGFEVIARVRSALPDVARQLNLAAFLTEPETYECSHG